MRILGFLGKFTIGFVATALFFGTIWLIYTAMSFVMNFAMTTLGFSPEGAAAFGFAVSMAVMIGIAVACSEDW